MVKMNELRKDKEVKNETLKGRFSSNRQRTEKSRKTTERSFKLSCEQEIISIKQLKRLVKKKTLVFLAVVWGQENKKVNAALKTKSVGLTEGRNETL